MSLMPSAHPADVVLDGNKLLEEVNGKVENAVNEVANKAQEALSNIPTDINGALKKGLSSLLGGLASGSTGMENLGIFENILCGNIPGLNIRMPEFKLNMLRDLNYDLDAIICGKSKQNNPFDAVIQLVDNISKFKNMFSNSDSMNIFNSLLNSNIGSLLKGLGINSSVATACLFSDAKGSSYFYSSPYGSNIKSKLGLANLLGSGCGGTLARSMGNAFGIQDDIIASSSFIRLIDHISKLDRNMTTRTVNDYWTNPSTRRNIKTAIYSGLDTAYGSANNTNVTYNKLYAIGNTLTNSRYNPNTGRVEVKPIRKENGLNVYGNVYDYTKSSNDKDIVVHATGNYNKNYPVYGFGPNSEPIIGYTTDGDPIYEYDIINNDNPILGYMVVPKASINKVDEDTATGEMNLSRYPIYGYDKTTGEPIIKVKENGDGVRGFDLYGGELITPKKNISYPTKAEESTYTTINNKPILYTTSGTPVYDFDMGGAAIVDIEKRRVNVGKDEIDSLKATPAGILDSGKYFYGYTDEGDVIVDYIEDKGVVYQVVYKRDTDVKIMTPYGSEAYDGNKATPLDIVDIRNDTDAVIRSLADTDLDELYKTSENPLEISNTIMSTLSILDKDWNRDEMGNTSMHRFTDNEVIKTLATDAINSQKEVGSDFLTGVYVTDLNLNEQIVVANATYEKDRTLY